MGTRASIAVMVKPQDVGKDIVPNIDLLGKTTETNIQTTHIDVSTKFISIFHNWDGHPHNLGKTLLEDFNSYEKALNLISFGNASSINGEVAVFYHSDFYGEHGFWEQTKPLQFNNETQLGCKCYLEYSEYNYLFKDGKWYENGKELEKIINNIK
jgi:hypothetical protein